jgi:hypothetical protein
VRWEPTFPCGERWQSQRGVLHSASRGEIEKPEVLQKLACGVDYGLGIGDGLGCFLGFYCLVRKIGAIEVASLLI